ncbi:hypothetical protein [Palaeococcus ferrophilus]|uniref:hypothetical protein n=1 Tax=Palaeococcus ferrophilus TaxID=83868 RepID=UPI0012F9586B|nr:hypothetical protein [Palaeococcus ferrophilus]
MASSSSVGATNITEKSEVLPVSQPERLNDVTKVPVYYVGSPEIGELIQKAGFTKVSVLNRIRMLPKEKGVMIISRKLNDYEVDLLDKALKNEFIIITVGKEPLDQMGRILSKMRAISVEFYYSDTNGNLVETEVYAYKVIKRLPNGKYGVYIKGYAGDVTPDVLKTAAFEAMTTEGSWETVHYISWSSYDSWKPYGKLNIEHALIYYTSDPWTYMDLWGIRAATQMIPGYKLGWSYFKNDYLKNMYYLKEYTNIYELRDYDPTSVSNVGASVGVTLSWTPPTLSWSYPGDYICRISDNSDFSTDIAGWYHDFCSWGSSGTLETLKIEPGFEFTVSPETTGKQEWKITAGWVMDEGGWHLTEERTVVIVFTLYY